MAPLYSYDDAFTREDRFRTIRRSTSLILPRSASTIVHTPTPTHVYTIKRSTSIPSFSDYRSNYEISSKYKPTWSPYGRYRNWDLYDEYWWDRSYYNSPLSYQYYYYPGRRYNYLDPPYSLWYNYPSLSYTPRSRYWYSDSIDPVNWRRYRDTWYDRYMIYNRPWSTLYDSSDVSRALDLYGKGLLGWDSLDRYWLRPSGYERRLWDTRYYPYRRYFY